VQIDPQAGTAGQVAQPQAEAPHDHAKHIEPPKHTERPISDLLKQLEQPYDPNVISPLAQQPSAAGSAVPVAPALDNARNAVETAYTTEPFNPAGQPEQSVGAMPMPQVVAPPPIPPGDKAAAIVQPMISPGSNPAFAIPADNTVAVPATAPPPFPPPPASAPFNNPMSNQAPPGESPSQLF